MRHKFYAMYSNLRTLFSIFRNTSDWLYAFHQKFWSILAGLGVAQRVVWVNIIPIKALSMIEYQFRLILTMRHKFYAIYSKLRNLFSGLRNELDWFHEFHQKFWGILAEWGAVLTELWVNITPRQSHINDWIPISPQTYLEAQVLCDVLKFKNTIFDFPECIRLILCA